MVGRPGNADRDRAGMRASYTEHIALPMQPFRSCCAVRNSFSRQASQA